MLCIICYLLIAAIIIAASLSAFGFLYFRKKRKELRERAVITIE